MSDAATRPPVRLAVYASGSRPPALAGFLADPQGALASPSAPRTRIPPHCSRCGRFLPRASLRSRPNHPEDFDYETTGVCPAHGRVDVSWERA